MKKNISRVEIKERNKDVRIQGNEKNKEKKRKHVEWNWKREERKEK